MNEHEREHSVKLVEEGQTSCVSLYQQGECVIRHIWDSLPFPRRAVPSKAKSYPPVSSIPRTSPERLTLAAADQSRHDDASISTVFYLAYGSNLSAEAFLGNRGIQPVSQINVSAPALDLTFDLPGLPYMEPCFANTAPRKAPKPPIPGDPPKFPPPPSSSNASIRVQEQEQEQDVERGTTTTTTALLPTLPSRGPKWSKGLYGVVYEVTREDYTTIIRTEGGGAAYQDVLTPCVALPPPFHVPEKPPIPELPKPFLAHTLYAPRLPAGPPSDGDNENGKDNGIRGDGDDHDHDGRDDDDNKKKWYRRLLRPVRRPEPDYAQASARYLKLITDGAAEHYLPDDYQAYLAALQAYTITTWRQEVGRLLFALVFVPLLGLLRGLSAVFADGEGRVPRWLGLAMMASLNLMWMAYDAVFKPVFGDGERTEDEEEDEEDRARGRRRSRRPRSWGDEKNTLLGDW